MKNYFMLMLVLSLWSCRQKKVKVACVGDSITFGSGLKRVAQDSYPAQLNRFLGDNWEVGNFGLSGATLLKKGDLSYWESQEFGQAQSFAPDIVVIKLGTNDAKNHNWQFRKTFEDDYKEMISVFSKLESKPTIFICHPIPVYPNPYIDGRIIANELLPKIDAIAKDTGVKLIPLFHVLTDKPALFPDGIHPNEEGARLIADAVKLFLLENYSRN